MAKVGESLIDDHNEYVAGLEESIRVEIEKRKALTGQLGRIEELLQLASGECEQPLIVERKTDNGKV